MSVVGETRVYNINEQCLNTITVKQSFDRYGGEIYEAYNESEKIGKMEIQWFRILPNLESVYELRLRRVLGIILVDFRFFLWG